MSDRAVLLLALIQGVVLLGGGVLVGLYLHEHGVARLYSVQGQLLCVVAFVLGRVYELARIERNRPKP